MDWLRLFALLIAVASVQIAAEGPKKKIRIHLPQKVKHIHHHKKIYITNHPASSQYAPAYLPSAEGAVAVPTNIGLPAVASIVPLNSVEQLYDEPPAHIPGNKPSSSKLLPLYRARGYYGPTPAEWEDQDYDLASPPEAIENAEYSAPSPAPTVSNHPPKRVKIIKVNETPRKKVNRKQKPKRIPVRSRPRPEAEEEHPVSSFHEQFYSDVDGSGTIRKIRKPQRVEKIIDGDTEHIHTYSEEHIHKVVFDDGPKLPGVVGVDSVGSMSALSAARPMIPLHNGQALLAIPPDTLTGFSAVGSLGTPSHLEYAAYNPRDVTHDHIFHDHGELPPDVDITKETLGLPPKISYNNQGLRINGGGKKRLKSKYNKPTKPTPVNEFSYYESIYTPYNAIKKVQKPKLSHYDTAPEASLNDYRSIPSLKVVGKKKPRSYGQAASEYRLQQGSAPAPFSVSSTIVHDYQPKAFPGALPPSGFSKYRDPFVNFKDSYGNNFEYDTFASSSNVHTSSDKNDNSVLSIQGPKGKKKSISTQNISFGGQHDHQSTIDHLEESAVSAELNVDETPSALENFSSFDDNISPEPVTSTPYTIKESSPVHQYYTAMAIKALQSEQVSMPEASNTNFQYVEAPPQSTTPNTPSVATTASTPMNYFEMQNSNMVSTQAPEFTLESDPRRRKAKNSNKLNLEQEHRQRYSVLLDYKSDDKPQYHQEKYAQDQRSDPNARGQLKYGDKI